MNTSNSTDSANQLAYMSAAELFSEFRKRTLSPVEVATTLLDRIDALDGPVRSIVHVDAEYTLAMARASEARHLRNQPLGPLDGVPVTIKDLSAVTGMPLRRGSLAFEPGVPSTADTPCVARLREQGTVFLAKTATPDAGSKVVTRSAVHGATANPYDPGKTPGGSSGGASAALAMGFGPLAVGSDGAGSIRIPAAYTNVFGLKPGFGRVSAFPPDIDMPHSVVGPMARTVEDAALMLAAMARPDSRDPFAWPIPFIVPSDLANPVLNGFRIAFSARLGVTSPLVDTESDDLVAIAAPLLRDSGAEVEEADPHWPVDPLQPFEVFWNAACAATVRSFSSPARERLDPLLLSVGTAASGMLASTYIDAVQQRLALTSAAHAFFQKYDLLIGPVMPIPAFSVEREVPPGFQNGNWAWCPYTYLWNMTGQPAASVPIGFTQAGLPVGVQVIGRIGGEADVLRACAAIQRRRPLYERRPQAPIGLVKTI